MVMAPGEGPLDFDMPVLQVAPCQGSELFCPYSSGEGEEDYQAVLAVEGLEEFRGFFDGEDGEASLFSLTLEIPTAGLYFRSSHRTAVLKIDFMIATALFAVGGLSARQSTMPWISIGAIVEIFLPVK